MRCDDAAAGWDGRDDGAGFYALALTAAAAAAVPSGRARARTRAFAGVIR